MATSEEIAAHRSVIRFCVDLGLTPVETQKKMQSTERHKNVSRALVYKWHRRYSDGLSADPQKETRGRPTGKDECIVKDVQRIINKDRRQTVREVADVIGCGKSTVHRALSDDFSMSRVSARWIPKLLTAEEKVKRVEASHAFLAQVRRDRNFLDRIVTTDETWLHYYEPEGKRESSVWKHPEPHPQRRRR